MALEGSIKDFGVADILQLIAQQQKTGVLLVEYEGIVAEIYFSAGAVIDATSSHHTARFEQIMVKSGMLSADIVKGARERAEKTLEPLYLVLLRENLVERDVLERILLTQLYETFYMILQWREGTYRFIPQPVKTTTNVVQVPSLETILLDVLRMIDEWPSLKSSIHSFAYVFEPNPEIARDTLDPEEIMVLGFFDGKKKSRTYLTEACWECSAPVKLWLVSLSRVICGFLARRLSRDQGNTSAHGEPWQHFPICYSFFS